MIRPVYFTACAIGLIISEARLNAATPDEIKAAAKKLAVTDVDKYKPTGGETKCNFFLQDFGKEIFGSIPDEFKGQANDIAEKLEKSKDWTAHKLTDAKATFAVAQKAANAGTFVIIAFKSKKGEVDKDGKPVHGHVTVVVPSREPGGAMKPSGKWGMDVPLIAQAGAKVFDYDLMSFGFTKDKADRMLVFIRK